MARPRRQPLEKCRIDQLRLLDCSTSLARRAREEDQSSFLVAGADNFDLMREYLRSLQAVVANSTFLARKSLSAPVLGRSSEVVHVRS